MLFSDSDTTNMYARFTCSSNPSISFAFSSALPFTQSRLHFCVASSQLTVRVQLLVHALAYVLIQFLGNFDTDFTLKQGFPGPTKVFDRH